jgi:SAM-dependent methyltransferase
LLDMGYTVAVLDVSDEALGRARERLGARAGQVRWIVADVTEVADVGRFDVWHDRAAFHFLTSRYDRRRYVGLLKRTVPPGGHAVIATFAPDGPARCSGLEVVRYDGESLARELGDDFELLRSVPETHVTPWGQPQSFQYSAFRHRPAGTPGEVEP